MLLLRKVSDPRPCNESGMAYMTLVCMYIHTFIVGTTMRAELFAPSDNLIWIV